MGPCVRATLDRVCSRVCQLHGTPVPRVCGSQWTTSGQASLVSSPEISPGVSIASLMPYSPASLKTVYLRLKKVFSLVHTLDSESNIVALVLWYGPILMTLFI